jgi:hypothetical protein
MSALSVVLDASVEQDISGAAKSPAPPDHILVLKKGVEIDHVGMRRERLVFPVQQARVVEHPVLPLASCMMS